MLIRSTTARFVLLAFLLQLAVTAGALFFVQEASKRALASEQSNLVDELRDELVAAWRSGGSSELRALIHTRLSNTHGAVSVILYADSGGHPIAGNLYAWPQGVPENIEWKTIRLIRNGSIREEYMGVNTIALPDGSRLLSGHVIESSLRLARVNEEAVIAALIVGGSMALLGALTIGRALSRQVGKVASTANAVAQGQLAQRVATDGSGDAFDTLGRSINAMLDRIEALVSQLRMITDGLAHDLRSPVTRMKSVIERAILETRDSDTLTALERVSQEAETLLHMLSSALQISRAEAGIGRDRFADTDVTAMLDDLAEVYGPLVEDNGFTLYAGSPPGLRANLHREFISQAIGNLIENALKYAVDGSKIMLSAREELGDLVLAVADDGPGIAPEQRSDALKRFGRLDPARHVAGSGLGLSLVEAIVQLHGGTLLLEDNTPGLRVVMRLAGALHR